MTPATKPQLVILTPSPLRPSGSDPSPGEDLRIDVGLFRKVGVVVQPYGRCIKQVGCNPTKSFGFQDYPHGS